MRICRTRVMPIGLLAVALIASACQRDEPRRAAATAPTRTTSRPGTSNAGETTTCTEGRGHAPGQTPGTISTGGLERAYLLYVPKGYDGRKRVPLVFNFHGHGSAAAAQIVYGDFRSIADREGFVIVAPDGQGDPRHFNLFEATSTDADDTAFTLALLDDLSKQLCVDEKRVYATGMSNGGAISSALACRAADRFAAVGPVAVVLYLPQCESAKRAVPIAGFMGTADPVVPFDGGRVNCCGNPSLPSAPSSMANFAKHHGCAEPPEEKRLSPMVLLRRWSRCKDMSAVDFYIIEGGGHTWPGSPIDLSSRGLGATTAEISASEAIWTFFSEHTLP